MKSGGIVLAGGMGSRFGTSVPKQLQPLCGKVILEYSLGKFREVLDEIVVVSHPDWIEDIRNIIQDKGIIITAGGFTRQLSVYAGLQSLKHLSLDVVVIHDSARPLFTKELLKNSMKTACEKGSAIPVIPVTSSLACVDGGKIISYANRDNYYAIQTPQSFRFDQIYKAHEVMNEQAINNLTDDSQVFEKLYGKADIIPGEEANIKITNPMDLHLAELLLKKGGCTAF